MMRVSRSSRKKPNQMPRVRMTVITKANREQRRSKKEPGIEDIQRESERRIEKTRRIMKTMKERISQMKRTMKPGDLNRVEKGTQEQEGMLGDIEGREGGE
jgi:hypothetical protein